MVHIYIALLSKALYSVFTVTDIHPFTHAHIHTPTAESTTQGDSSSGGTFRCQPLYFILDNPEWGLNVQNTGFVL